MLCKCEAKTPPGVRCSLCMGKVCSNRTYEFNGNIYNLVDAVLLWATGSYDGPMSGIAAYKGFACYAKCYTFYRDRSYWLYPLRDSEWKQELVQYAKSIDGSCVNTLDRKVYTGRNPLGFFRIENQSDPLKTNRIGDSFRQREYQHFFKDLNNDIHR